MGTAAAPPGAAAGALVAAGGSGRGPPAGPRPLASPAPPRAAAAPALAAGAGRSPRGCGRPQLAGGGAVLAAAAAALRPQRRGRRRPARTVVFSGRRHDKLGLPNPRNVPGEPPNPWEEMRRQFYEKLETREAAERKRMDYDRDQGDWDDDGEWEDGADDPMASSGADGGDPMAEGAPPGAVDAFDGDGFGDDLDDDFDDDFDDFDDDEEIDIGFERAPQRAAASDAPGPKAFKEPEPGDGAQLYDDFELSPEERAKRLELRTRQATVVEPQDREATGKQRRRPLRSLEERQYVVTAEGIAIRVLPDEKAPRTGELFRKGDTFTAVEAVEGEGLDKRLYLKLPDGKGWVFDDSEVYPGFPSVRLAAKGGLQIEEPKPDGVKRPVVAIIGRPNVGKSSLVNILADNTEHRSGITLDQPGVTRDRAYVEANWNNLEGDTFMFELVDTGGLVYALDPSDVTFEEHIREQVDVALREAVAAVFVVDARAGLMRDDMRIAEYLKSTYVKRGLRVIVAVAKCDRLETERLKCVPFFELGLGDPIPFTCKVRGRGVWEVGQALVGANPYGVFPMRPKVKGQEMPMSLRDSSTSIAIIGRPNAGKSSLLNAFVGEERSLVSDIAGTTTDSVDAYLETESGKRYRFVDTAGIRKSSKLKTNLDWLAVNRSVKAMKRAQCVLLCLDASEVMHHCALGGVNWAPTQGMRYVARKVEEIGCACVIVLTKWDAVPDKDATTQRRFVEAIRARMDTVGQWAEIVTCSAKTGIRMHKVLEAVEKTMASHQKRVPTPTLNEVVRDALLWKLPPQPTHSKRKQGRVYYATQTSTEPPVIKLFCNTPKLFTQNYLRYFEHKIRQDLAWFGTPLRLEWVKRRQRSAEMNMKHELGPRLMPSEPPR